MAKIKHIEPTRDDNRLPLHSDECPSYDGKRCKLMGFRPDRFCEPALIDERQPITRLVGDPPVCAYLSDGTKIRVGRTAETKGPAWLEHVQQDRLRPQGKEPK